jgi:glycosyltransferase involved in cell wall biosynthesis
MRISVVIATYNRRDLLTRTLPTVLMQDFPADEYEILVVVDGSTDGTIEMLRGLKPPTAFSILEQPNRGLAAARNAGLKAAGGELVLFLDDDILCDRLLLKAHAAAHQGRAPEVVFGPVLLAPESPPRLAAEWRRASAEKALARCQREGEARWSDDFAVTANYSLPRSMALACGGFDDRFKSRREDLELGLRLRKSGVRFRYEPTAITRELYLKSTSGVLRSDGTCLGRNEILLCRTHPDWRSCSALAGLEDGPLWRRLARG